MIFPLFALTLPHFSSSFFVPESFICVIHSRLFKVTSLLLFPGTGFGTQIRDCLIRAERREPRERKMWVLDKTNRTPTKCLLSKDPKAQIPPSLPEQPWLCLFFSYHLFSLCLCFLSPFYDIGRRQESQKVNLELPETGQHDHCLPSVNQS